MESTTAKLTFLSFADTSDAERELLEGILKRSCRVQLPVSDQCEQPVPETCRLPPDGTEYDAEETTTCSPEPPPPPQQLPPTQQQPQPPPPPQPLHHMTQNNQPGLAGDLSAGSPSPLMPPHHMMSHMMNPGAPMFHQPGGYFNPNMYNMYNMGGGGGGGGGMMMSPYGYQMSPYGTPEPPPPEPATNDRRGGRGGKKGGGEKQLSALAAPYQAASYPLTPRTATGPPLMMQPYGGHVPYGAPYGYPYPYPYGYGYPGGEMMLLSPHQLQQMQQQQQQQQMDMTVPPPQQGGMSEESRTPLCEPYGRAEEAAQPEDDADVEEEDVPIAFAPEEEAVSTPPPASPPRASPVVSIVPAAASAPVPAPTGPVRLSFGFDLDEKLLAGESEAVQLENTGMTPEPVEDEERVGDGRSSSAEPTAEPAIIAPTSYVATVTVSQRRVMPPPPHQTVEEEEVPAVDSGRASAEPEMAMTAGSPEPVSETPEPTASNGVRSPEPQREPERVERVQEPAQLKREPEPVAAPAAAPAAPATPVTPAVAPAVATPTATPAATPVAAPAVPSPAPAPAAAPAAAPAPAPAPSAPRSWASLFSKRSEGVAPAPAAPVTPKPAPAPPVPETDKEVLALGEVLARFEPCHKNVYLQPRGLTNKSNWCYINAVLQALASCTPFYHLMKSLPHNVGVLADRSRTPIIDAMVEFVHEFSPLPAELSRPSRRERERRELRDMQPGPPLEPSYVYAMLARVSTDAFRVAGRQEDAEEFLTCLLSGLQDEMAEVLKVYQKSREDAGPPVNGATNGDARHHHPDDDDIDEEDDSDDWQTIIGKNRGQVTRSAELQSTPVSRLFSGQLRSSLHRQGAKATATVQSFFSLQLDIQNPQVSSVEQALAALVERDPVVGLTCAQTGQPVDAYQQAALELTPPTLILHLKRFLYDSETDGVQKLLKRVTFPIDLELKKELLSNVRTKMAPGLKRYRLFAVIYHSGKESTKGHYITDAYHPAYQQWVRYDDSSISAVAEASVLRPEPPLVPYILFYRRLDTVGAHNGK